MADTRWYAVRESRQDGWSNGSYSYDEAVAMLKAQGQGLIAVINERSGEYEEEIEYSDIFLTD